MTSPSQRATEVEARAILAEWTPELEAERLKLCLNVVERADAYGGSAARLYHEAEMALTLLGDIVSRAQAAITALDGHREAQPRELNTGQTLRTWALAKFGDRPNGAAIYSLFHTYGEEIAQVVLDAHRAGGVETAPFNFDRYVNGVLMAEGVRIHRAATLDEAIARALLLCRADKNLALVYRAARASTPDGGGAE